MDKRLTIARTSPNSGKTYHLPAKRHVEPDDGYFLDSWLVVDLQRCTYAQRCFDEYVCDYERERYIAYMEDR